MPAPPSTSDRFAARLDELDNDGRLPIPKWAALELVDRGLLNPAAELVPPLFITPTPAEDRRAKHYEAGAWFDVDAVAKVVRALRGLRHTKGRRWAGKPLDPEAWQVLWVVAPIFGWKNAAGLRIVRKAWIEIPRKNGKSTLASGLAIVLLVADGELGAEVYSAATTTSQARQVFEPAKQMAIGSPHLRGKVKPLADLLRVPRTGSFFRVLSRVADAAHGLNVHGAVVDEIHVHRDRALIDAIETGTGAREQPLVVLITTSDDGKKHTPYDEQRGEIEALVSDLGEPDHSTYGAIWTAPEGLDPFVLETIRMANPGIGVTVSEEYLLKQARRAQRSPAYMPVFERLHLNRRRRAEKLAVDMARWELCNDPAMSLTAARRELRDREAFGGLDLSTTEDFTAWCVVVPDLFTIAGEEVEGAWVLPRLWVPRAAVERRTTMRSTFELWQNEGWITITDGDVVDYDRLEADIGEDAEAFRISEFAFDPWQAEMLRQHLLDGGLAGWKCGQTMERLAPATQEFDRLLGLGAFRFLGNPALAWMASNVVAKGDAQGRWKPEKSKASEKTDGFMALTMALASWRRPDRERHRPPATARAAGAEDADPADLYRPTGPLDI